jgi:hypothetical protein
MSVGIRPYAAAMSKVIRRGVRAVICTGKTGALPAVAAKDGRQGETQVAEHVIQHIV